MTFRPLHDRVLVRRAEDETSPEGGIIIPGAAGEAHQKGQIIVVGPVLQANGSELTALDVSAGDIVLFDKWSGIEVKVNGQTLVMLKKADILRIVERATAVEEAA
ncbi:co-chaperone GroES [Amorphus sp. 3PC139-8]|uniref:co-chaperone GroES n=1 Tax=Amorphus sp. 3PC139-8 TaxID=2735676 RepID=UPI00345D1587